MKISFNNTINFGTRNDVKVKSDNFIENLLNENAKHKLNFPKLKNQINQVIPEINVQKMKYSDPKRKFLHGFFTSKIGITENDSDYCLENPFLALNVQIFSNKKTYKELLSTVVHETTHAFQALDDEMSNITLYRKYLPPNQPKVIDINLQALNNFFVDMYNKILFDIHNAFCENGEIHEIMMLTDKLINNENIFSKKKIKDILSETLNKYPDADKNFILAAERLRALQEADAYKQEAKFRKKINMPSEITNFQSQVYSMLAETLSNIE